MRMLTLAAAFLVSAPLQAQENQGRDLMAEALGLFMRGLMDEVEPAFEGLEDLMQDLNAYHAPEVMPNGDIIIRRKQPDAPTIEDDGEVDL